MKKISTLLLGLSASFAMAQCEILGNSTLNIGEIATYSIGNEWAQCKQCHFWSTTGNTEVVGDNRLNTIQVRAKNTGTSTLSLQYFSTSGLVNCSKDITIVGQNTQNQTNTDSHCDILLTNFREVMTGANSIAFFPDTNQELNYTWKVVYSDGTEATSNEKVPEFHFSAQKPIESVNIQVASKSCFKKFTKTYNEAYWKNF